MAKAKKEFRNRVRKVQKHVSALIDLAVSDDQREALYETERKVKWLGETQAAYFDDPANGSEPPEDIREARKDPRSIAN